MRIRIATRGSDLALWQARHVAARLRELGGDLEPVVETYTTRGDRETGPLSELGGQGLFTAEVDRALRDDRADIAVHSLKDLPIETPGDLVIAAIPERGPVEDVLISQGNLPLARLGEGARVGSSSPRRAAYVRSVRPDLEVVELRGNVPTRLSRVASGELAATVMARAGLVRLGRDAAISEILSGLLPAPGQGALGIVARKGTDAARIAAAMDHAETRAAVQAERGVLAGLGGGCSLPLGVRAQRRGGRWHLASVLFLVGGASRLEDEREGDDPARLARESAEALIEKGATA